MAKNGVYPCSAAHSSMSCASERNQYSRATASVSSSTVASGYTPNFCVTPMLTLLTLRGALALFVVGGDKVILWLRCSPAQRRRVLQYGTGPHLLRNHVVYYRRGFEFPVYRG